MPYSEGAAEMSPARSSTTADNVEGAVSVTDAAKARSKHVPDEVAAESGADVQHAEYMIARAASDEMHTSRHGKLQCR